MTAYTPKTYTPEENRQLAAAWAKIERDARRTGIMPDGVARLGEVRAMGQAGHAQPTIPILASANGEPLEVAVLDRLDPAVRWALDTAATQVNALLTQRRGGAGMAFVTNDTEADEGVNSADAIKRFNPLEHRGDVTITYQLAGG